MNRRNFVRLAGVSLVLMTAGGGLYTVTRAPSKALAPWEVSPSKYEDPRMRALSRAILAPNPHNRQPWMIAFLGDDRMMLYCDPGRLLPETDPFERQIVIGLGCFLELLRMAAAEDGYHTEMTPFPEGGGDQPLDTRPVALVRFSRSDQVTPDHLFGQVRARRSNKEPFDTTRPVEASALTKLRGGGTRSVHVCADNDRNVVKELRDLTWRAHMVEVTTPQKYLESIHLMRLGKTEIENNPDGIDLGGPVLDPMIDAGLITREKLADPTSFAFRSGIEMYRDVIFSAMAYAWIVTDGNRRDDQLHAGQAWVRLNLAATALGIGVHPLSQALQEYSEMTDLYDELRDKLGIGGDARIQMLGRLGYGPTVAPSPRWPLDAKLRTT